MAKTISRHRIARHAAARIRGLEYRLGIITATSAHDQMIIKNLRGMLAKERAQHATIIAQLSRELARHAETATAKHRYDAAAEERAT